MKRLLLASVTFTVIAFSGLAFSSLAMTSALAADLPPRLPSPQTPVYVPFFSWNGFYIGINAGYGWGQSSWTSAVAATGAFNVTGPLAGGTLGYNVQTGAWVFGLEGDYDWANIKGSTTVNCPLGCETKLGWLATVRGRLGYALDRFLPYITAGGAFGNIKATTPGFAGASQTQAGWTAGLGVEYAFVSNWSAKLEYLYVDLGKFDCGTACGAVPPDDIKFTTHILRAGLNYKF